jgi:hypothetical protein
MNTKPGRIVIKNQRFDSLVQTATIGCMREEYLLMLGNCPANSKVGASDNGSANTNNCNKHKNENNKKE